ncbi:MAG: 2-amino-4-hydroxy-6-hydroxymethyldihydropteridine diphosphokinase [Syntrophomonadaceae bacterium]
MKRVVYLGLGSNLGDKKANLEKALEDLGSADGVRITRVSSLYQSEPWGVKDQDDFINQVIEIETELSALDLLHLLQTIEIDMGRQRVTKWGPRNIDLDILLYGDEVLRSEELQVPHAHMRERLFVLIPLQEINSEIVFPDDGTSLREVLVRVPVRERNVIKKL